MTQPAPDLPGFRFERTLGSGGYSDVYLYRQALPSRPVAVKVLKTADLGAVQQARFTAEANAMAGLADHPNIVPVFSAAVSADGRPYLVMQYYSQPNLSVRAASERLGVPEVLRVGIQIASAVETAHRAGILHRDIKPANLLISQYGTPGLTDFGIAGQLADLDDDEDTGVSVPWAAPEVLYATGPSSVQSDVYSLAATLWHLLVGRSPFEARGGDNSAFAIMRRVRDVPPPPTGRPDVPDSLERVLRQAMSKDPRGRPATAIEFARRLQAVEQELSLPRTQIVVTTDAHGDTGDRTPPEHYNTSPSTVARPLSVAPQQPLTYQPAPPDAHAGAPPTAVRPEAFSTGRRVAPPDEPEPKRSRTVPLLIAAVVVLVVGAGVAAFALAGGREDPKPKNTISQDPGTQDALLPGQNIPPGVPKVVGRRSGSVVTFRWSYDAARSDDTFQWRRSDADQVAVVTRPALQLRSAARVCIRVRVVRADGTDASATFSPEGCA